ncbi:hypothetical protein AVEN_122870-1 [Araneus ventricosus]|uniref:thiol oxidase n=1 Tax=Araneus ventricosus TaxID=182803 RepID=A0A4Y2QQU9_ARAVE|nr:hypothetical protein AVEN_122870-1 [Araneus ventricosus]
MRHKTFQTLRRAYLGNVELDSLSFAQSQEKDPLIQRYIDLATKKIDFHVEWNRLPFTSEFRSVPPRERLDETVLTFLLRAAAIVKDEFYRRSFGKPESSSVLIAWTGLLKQCMFSVLTLLYNVQWTSEKMFLLDNTILDLIHEGRAGALRDLFKSLDVPLARRDLTDAERHSDRLVFLHVGQFGSFFWRMIHWMGEAVNVKKEQDDPDVKLAIRIWKNFALESMYRLLRCSICMMHLRMLTQELKSQLMDETVDYARLWYNIHNLILLNDSPRMRATLTFIQKKFTKRTPTTCTKHFCHNIDSRVELFCESRVDAFGCRHQESHRPCLVRIRHERRQ